MQHLTTKQVPAASRRDHIRTWRERGADAAPRPVRPYLCLLRGDNPVSQALEPDDCPILRLGVYTLLRPGTLGQAWRFIRFLRRERIDVVQTYFPDSSYFGVPAAW